MKFHVPMILLLIISCNAYATINEGSINNKELTFDNLLNLKAEASQKKNNTRERVIYITARTMGYRKGLEAQGKRYKQWLEARASSLNAIYQFQTLMGQGNVLPPVIVEAKNTINVNRNQMRIASRIYAIIEPEKMVSIPPTWRDYLYTGLLIKPKLSLPMGDLRPKSDKEIKVWKEGLHRGWQEGKLAAHTIFSSNLNRLDRDYLGMNRYYILNQQNIISSTYVAEGRTRVSGNAQKIIINDHYRRLITNAALQKDTSTWKANREILKLIK